MKPLAACTLLLASILLAHADTGNRQWTLDLKKMIPPGTPVAGKINGKDFKLDKIKFDPNGALTLQQGTEVIFDAAIIIFLPEKSAKAVAGKSYEISAEKVPGKANLPVHLKWKPAGETLPKGNAYLDGYALKLSFAAEKDGVVTAKIYICMPDEAKSFIAGTFSVDAK